MDPDALIWFLRSARAWFFLASAVFAAVLLAGILLVNAVAIVLLPALERMR